MVSYFTPTLFPLSEEQDNGRQTDSSSTVSSHAKSRSSGSWVDFSERSIEQLRGSPAVRPPHIFGRPLLEHEEEPSFEEPVGPSPFESVRRLQVPEEALRKIPGCGINQYALFNVDDESIRAETSPIDPDFFGRKVNTYARARSGPPRRRFTFRCTKNPQPPTSSVTAALLGSTQSQERHPSGSTRGSRHPFFNGQRSPYSSSSSSSSSLSSSPPPPYEGFQPLSQSSFMQTPPRQRYSAPRERVQQHPSLVPSYFVLPPDYYPSPQSSPLRHYEELLLENTCDIIPVRSNLFASAIGTGSLQRPSGGSFGMTYICPSPSSSSYSTSTTSDASHCSSGNIVTFGSSNAPEYQETSEGSYDADASEYSTD